MLNMVLHNFPRNWPLRVRGDVVSIQDLRPASKKEPRWTTRPTDPRFETNRPKPFNCHFFGLLVFFPDQICRCGETRDPRKTFSVKLFRSETFVSFRLLGLRRDLAPGDRLCSPSSVVSGLNPCEKLLQIDFRHSSGKISLRSKNVYESDSYGDVSVCSLLFNHLIFYPLSFW